MGGLPPGRHAPDLRILESAKIPATACRVFAFSDFVADNCIRTPALLTDLVQSGDLARAYSRSAWPTRVRNGIAQARDDTTLGHCLCRIRRREMLRIAWRDLAGAADLDETLEDLSAFADACLQEALSALERQLTDTGTPPRTAEGCLPQLVVIGMGKLGAGELNFSSDIDLVFTYAEPGRIQWGEKHVTGEEFFTRLCRRYVKILGSTSPDGPLYRVDPRLRPYGENGPLVMSVDAMENYYQHQGREWERYAWIKARTVAGDRTAGRDLLARLNPFIYRRYIDYTMFDSFREMKRSIEHELKKKGIRENIKNGPGGIREIEFFGQIFQLLRGGVMPVLQLRSIMAVLDQLAADSIIDTPTARKLKEAYRFLRRTENRLQEAADRQTHVLPAADQERNRLAASMDFSNWPTFKTAIDHHRTFVHRQFSHLLAMDTPETETKADTPLADLEAQLSTLWLDALRGDRDQAAVDTLADLGFAAPGDVMAALQLLAQDPATRAIGPEGRRRLDRLVPMVLSRFHANAHPIHALRGTLDLVRIVQRRTTYLSLLVENPDALVRLMAFSAASPWLITYLSRHPVLLDELLDPRTLYTPSGQSALAEDLQRRFRLMDPDDLEYQMEALRIFKQVNTLRVAAADIFGVLPLMKVSDYLSGIAETAVNKVLDLAWRHLVAKHGTPCHDLSDPHLARGFAVIAYGKLGGFELSYTSDLDLVFLHAGSSGTTAGGPRPIDNAQFYSRLGQRVIHLLTAHTPAGVLYNTDMRLRPSGDAGLIVSHIDAFEAYLVNDAWTWEHQALVRARAIWGDSEIRRRFAAIRERALAQPRNRATLRGEVAEMRRRMRQTHTNQAPGLFDLKHDPGAMVDIEFMVQYVVLLMAHRHPGLLTWTDNVRLIQSLAQTGLIDDHTAHLLRTAYLAYRAMAHRLSLREKPAVVAEHTFQALRDRIVALWHRLFGPA